MQCSRCTPPRTPPPPSQTFLTSLPHPPQPVPLVTNYALRSAIEEWKRRQKPDGEARHGGIFHPPSLAVTLLYSLLSRRRTAAVGGPWEWQLWSCRALCPALVLATYRYRIPGI